MDDKSSSIVPSHILVVDDEPEIAESLADFLAKKEGYRITRAGDGREAMELLQASLGNPASAVDLVLLDIKQWDPERHKDLTGVDNAPTLAFARRLAARHRPVWLRYVLVPGLTDDPEDIGKTASFVAGLGNVARVDVLPFHQMGRYKWAQLGLEYTLDHVEPPAPEVVEWACGVFKSEGLRAH